MTETTMKHLPIYFKYINGKSFYCYCEDGIQYQMKFKSLLQLKEFLRKHYNKNMELPVNSWYRQLSREDKNEVLIIIKPYSNKA